MPTCKSCGKKCDGEYCFQHKPRKPLKAKKGIQVWAGQDFIDKYEDTIRKTVELQQFFLHIWKKKPHKSEVSQEYLGSQPLSTFFHHILPKSKYPEAALDEENIILLTLNEHEQVEMDMYRYEEVNQRRIKLLEKYEGTK